jgi:hypothetical protein
MVYRILLITTFVACSHDPKPTQQGVIGPTGGTVAAGQSAWVVVPANALTSNTTITLNPTDASPPANTLVVATPYLFGPEGTQFAVPVTVALEFSPNLMPSGMTAANIVVYTAPANTTDYQPLTTTIVDDMHISAQTTHFSIFLGAVASPHQSVDAGVHTDAGASMCNVTVSGGAQQCVISSNCNGHYYSATCNDFGMNSSCNCHMDNGPYHQVSGISGTCSNSTGQPGWGACGFP